MILSGKNTAKDVSDAADVTLYVRHALVSQCRIFSTRIIKKQESAAEYGHPVRSTDILRSPAVLSLERISLTEFVSRLCTKSMILKRDLDIRCA